MAHELCAGNAQVIRVNAKELGFSKAGERVRTKFRLSEQSIGPTQKILHEREGLEQWVVFWIAGHTGNGKRSHKWIRVVLQLSRAKCSPRGQRRPSAFSVRL